MTFQFLHELTSLYLVEPCTVHQIHMESSYLFRIKLYMYIGYMKQVVKLMCLFVDVETSVHAFTVYIYLKYVLHSGYHS